MDLSFSQTDLVPGTDMFLPDFLIFDLYIFFF